MSSFQNVVNSDQEHPFGHQVLFTKNSPEPGPNYVQGRVVDTRDLKTIFLSGQTGNEPLNDTVVEGGIRPQTKQALENIINLLVSAGAGLEHVVKISIFLKNIEDKAGFEEIYGQYFPGINPSRNLAWVSEIPLASEETIVEIIAETVVVKEASDS
jgi:2-iminobutanoate/2-iminopropanoate deaminase